MFAVVVKRPTEEDAVLVVDKHHIWNTVKLPEKGGPLRRGGDEGGGEQIYGRFVESPIFDVNFPHRCEFCLVVTVKVDGGVFEFGFNEGDEGFRV